MVRVIGLGCLGLLTIAAFVAASSNSVEQVKKKREVVQIADPVRDFYERYGDAGTNGIRDFKGVKKLLQIQFDVDSDGDDDAIVSSTMMVAGRAGTIWEFYLKEGDGYGRIEGAAVLRDDACVAGYWDAWKRNVVASFWPNGIEHGSWHAVYVKDDKIVDMPLDIEQKGPNTDFKGLKKIVHEEFLFDDLKEKYEAPAKDPVREFYKNYEQMKIGGADEFKGEKKLLKMEFDVDSDGDDDILISTTMLTDGKAGTMWHVYLREGDTFRWISGSATLRRDACLCGYWDAWKRNIVASYWPNGVENGSWHAVYVKDDKIVDMPLDIEKKGPNTDFNGLKKIVPEEFLFDDLKKEYEAPAKQEPKPTGAATDEANGKAQIRPPEGK